MKQIYLMAVVAGFASLLIGTFPGPGWGASGSGKLIAGLKEVYLKYYTGQADGGLAHVTYWTLATDSDVYQALEP